MGIWIRSQDGNILTLCTDINIQTQTETTLTIVKGGRD